MFKLHNQLVICVKMLSKKSSFSATTKPKTRVLNAKKYLRQYGSAPASRVGSPEPVERSNRTGKRTVIKPGAHKANNIKSSRGSRLISPK